MSDRLASLLGRLPGASLLSSLGELIDAVRAASDSELLGLTSIAGARELFTRLIARDFHPAAVWSFYAADRPDELALVEADRRLTWREADERINRLANALLDRGVVPGDRVAVMLENSIAWFEISIACQKIGASTVFVSYRSAAPEVGYLLANSQASMLLFGAAHTDVVREARVQSSLPDGCWIRVGGDRADDEFADFETMLGRGAAVEPAADLRRGGSRTILYTSGTTGRPKGAVRDLSKATLGTLLGLLRRIPFRRSDRHLVAAPLYHATGSGFATLSATLGSTVHVMEKFDAEDFLRIVDRAKITTTALVPTMIRAIVDLPAETRRRYDVSSLRIVISTGSALNESLERAAFEALGEVIYDLYGSTEMAYVTVATPADKRACPGTIGLPVPGVEVLLLDEQRRPVPDGEIGELFARSQLTVEGYHANEAATRESQSGDAFSVGDLAVRDPSGYLKLVGRKTDMVISGGMNVYPAEIEGALVSHPAVREAAVIGVPDEKWGEALIAFVAPHDGQQLPADDEIVAFLKKSLASYKVPRRFERVPALPRNPTGKILKNDLRSRITRAG